MQHEAIQNTQPAKLDFKDNALFAGGSGSPLVVGAGSDGGQGPEKAPKVWHKGVAHGCVLRRLVEK